VSRRRVSRDVRGAARRVRPPGGASSSGAPEPSPLSCWPSAYAACRADSRRDGASGACACDVPRGLPPEARNSSAPAAAGCNSGMDARVPHGAARVDLVARHLALLTQRRAAPTVLASGAGASRPSWTTTRLRALATVAPPRLRRQHTTQSDAHLCPAAPRDLPAHLRPAAGLHHVDRGAYRKIWAGLRGRARALAARTVDGSLGRGCVCLRWRRRRHRSGRPWPLGECTLLGNGRGAAPAGSSRAIAAASTRSPPPSPPSHARTAGATPALPLG
jgi:hypothetical protein